MSRGKIVFGSVSTRGVVVDCGRRGEKLFPTGK
jgi:hypothetical protein